MEPGTRLGANRSVSRTRCPRSARGPVPATAPQLSELFGLKASWGNGARSRGRNRNRPPVPAAGRGPTRVGDGSASFPTRIAARGRHTPAPALPNSFSLSFFFFHPHPLFVLFFYFKGFFSSRFPPFPGPSLPPRSVLAGGCGSPAPARPRPPRPGRNAAGAGDAARAEPGCREQPGQPLHGGFRSLLAAFVCRSIT